MKKLKIGDYVVAKDGRFEGHCGTLFCVSNSRVFFEDPAGNTCFSKPEDVRVDKELVDGHEVEILEDGLDSAECYGRVVNEIMLDNGSEFIFVRLDNGDVRVYPRMKLRFSDGSHFAKDDKVKVISKSVLAVDDPVGKIATVLEQNYDGNYVNIFIDGKEQVVEKTALEHVGYPFEPGMTIEVKDDGEVGVVLKEEDDDLVVVILDNGVGTLKTYRKFNLNPIDERAVENDKPLTGFEGALTVTSDGHTVTVSDGQHTGVARCNPVDTFDINIGFDLAFQRMQEQAEKSVEIGQRYYYIGRNEEGGKFTKGSFVFEDDEVDNELKERGNFFKTPEEADEKIRELETFLAEYNEVKGAYDHYVQRRKKYEGILD